MLNLSQLCLEKNGNIYPLIIPWDSLSYPTLMNPSIINVNNKLMVNIRNTNYFLYHAEKNKNEHVWGPLNYLHPEQNMFLATKNILAELDDNFNISGFDYIDTSFYDQPPKWEFHGLEDGRLAYWNNQLYLIGVRRDTAENGQGRMELSSLSIKNNKAYEVSRTSMPAPQPNASYCEKNWMPILDRPYHFVKWTNPTEVVYYDQNTQITHTKILTDYKDYQTGDLRGGSQVVSYKNYFIAIVHETDLYNSEAGRKDAQYYHRFVCWDKDFNLISVSPKFCFMDGKIEFSCGLCLYKDNFIVSFSFQDNAAFILKTPQCIIDDLLKI